MAQRRGPDGSVRVAVSGNYNAEAWANIFWANLIGGTTAAQADLDGWLTAFANQFNTVVGAHIPNIANISTATATLFQPGGLALHSVHTIGTTGTGGAGTVANNATCRVLSWSTNVYWRGGKPRTYLVGCMAAETTDMKTLTTAAQTAMAALAQAFHVAINGLSSGAITQTQHGFVSFMSGGVALEPGKFYPILGGTAHKRLGTQRGRLGPWVP